MQDQDVPPVEEGETGGGVVVVPRAVIPQVAPVATNSTAAFTLRPWTTVTARQWPAAIMARAPDVSVPALPLITRNLNPSRFRFAKTLPPESLLSWTISSFKPRFRKPRASST